MNQRVVLMDKLYEGMPPRPQAFDPGLDVAHLFFEKLGLYLRYSFVPAGQMVRTHVHPYDHYTGVAHGRGFLATDDETREVKKGDVIEVKAGCRHVYRAVEHTVWLCLHREKDAETFYGERP